MTGLRTPLMGVIAAASTMWIHASEIRAEDNQYLLDETIALAESLSEERDAVLDGARKRIAEGDRNAGFNAVEAYLSKNPGDIVAGNDYRKMAVHAQLPDRPIRFFLELLGRFDPNLEDDIHPPAPRGLRYNLAFAYIDKIPVVGPMGAGFLSKRSIAQFQVVLNEHPDDWIANYGVGMNYLHWPDYFEKNDSSVTYFETAIELQDRTAPRPLNMLPYIRLGDAYAKSNRIGDAARIWAEGIEVFGNYPDLTERTAIAPDKVKDVVTQAYNPNNSIGEINTDISIIWADEMPETLFPLQTGAQLSTFSHGVGGQKPAESSGDEPLFTWFQKNLPFLLNRESAKTLDMSYLGANTQDVAGVIAYDMIRGFMTQFHDDDPAVILAELSDASHFDRPFIREGIGMGLAARMDTGGTSLARFDEIVAPLGGGYDRLQYAGLGMWYGLMPTPNMVQINHALGDLPLRGQFYAYEGLGFAVTLFSRKPASYSAELARRMPFAAASTYAHGLGRALWIKHGSVEEEMNVELAMLPENLALDSRSGMGMGIAFTGVERPDEVVENLRRFSGKDMAACNAALGGAAMGYAIRYEADPDFVKASFRGATEPETRKILPGLLLLGLNALKEVEAYNVESHNNWRKAIQLALSEPKFDLIRHSACGDLIR